METSSGFSIALIFRQLFSSINTLFFIATLWIFIEIPEKKKLDIGIFTSINHNIPIKFAKPANGWHEVPFRITPDLYPAVRQL